MVSTLGRGARLRSGNEAIARGAWEAGVAVGCGYPGTPSTEILEALARMRGVYCEWAPNEKVALEIAVGACLAGARAIATMKHVGVNVAADPLFSAPYIGVNGGLVIVTADDPGMHSSQNEQDNRHYARAARLPLLEPASPEEARRYTRAAFELSERFDTPVLLRTTTALSHGKGVVRDRGRQRAPRREYVRNARKHVLLPAHARVRRHEIEAERMPALAEEAESWAKAFAGGDGPAIITAGPSFLYVREAFPDAPVLKLGMTYPLPARAILEFAAHYDAVTIVEELDPFLEEQIRALGVRVAPRVLPREGELSVDLLRRHLGGVATARPRAPLPQLPARPPALCAGCAHRNVFRVLGELDAIVAGDIGCYTLGALEPLTAMHTCLNMGASIPMAHGMRRALPPVEARRVVSVIGDSTFFHSGIPGLLDIVHNGGGGVTLVLDNATTAMTGHQDHPGVAYRLGTAGSHGGTAVDVAAVARAIGVSHVDVVDPYDGAALRSVLEQAIARDAATVVVARAPCVLRERRRFGDPLRVERTRCSECLACLDIGCPAITLVDGRPFIDRSACNGCALCAAVCNDCNTGLNVGRMLELVATGREREAIELLLATNPLPGITARVCPHPCDHDVNALGHDHHADYARRFPALVERFGDPQRPGRIAVREVERYLANLAHASAGTADVVAAGPRAGSSSTGGAGAGNVVTGATALSVGIVGAGPSALSAAWQLRRAGRAVVIYDEADQPGGVLRHGIPEFRLPRSVLDAEVERLLAAGIEFRGGVRVGTSVSLEGLRARHDALVLAIGFSRARTLSLDGADGVAGVQSGTAFLRAWNAGERPDLGRRVAVIGGGNTAIDCARAAARAGAEATIYYRRGAAEMPAIADEIEAARAEGVRIETLVLPRRVLADEPGRVRALELVGMQLGERDASGRARPQEVPGTERLVDADTVLIAAGELADLELLGESGVETGDGGARIAVEFTGATSEPGVFACGDVAFGHGTVTHAIGTGRRVADAVNRYLQRSGV